SSPMNRLGPCCVSISASCEHFADKTWSARPGAFFWEQDITHGYELATQSLSGERIRTEQPNMCAGFPQNWNPIRKLGWPQRHTPVNNVPFTHRKQLSTRTPCPSIPTRRPGCSDANMSCHK
ncbi:MAG: hypothetical protein L0287_05075, partial [Anaerolineae bacterium]|nr:hypothetical protein [Anaerolineae bacterium]